MGEQIKEETTYLPYYIYSPPKDEAVKKKRKKKNIFMKCNIHKHNLISRMVITFVTNLEHTKKKYI